MEIVKTENAPQSIGPYNQAIKSNGFVFCSGQIALKADGTLAEGDIRLQTAQVMENLKAVLDASGSSLNKVVKTTVYLSNMGDFVAFNEVYGSYFTDENKPARATVEVSRLPKDVKVEIDCIAEV